MFAQRLERGGASRLSAGLWLSFLATTHTHIHTYVRTWCTH